VGVWVYVVVHNSEKSLVISFDCILNINLWALKQGENGVRGFGTLGGTRQHSGVGVREKPAGFPLQGLPPPPPRTQAKSHCEFAPQDTETP